jgi:hypothetical protein
VSLLESLPSAKHGVLAARRDRLRVRQNRRHRPLDLAAQRDLPGDPYKKRNEIADKTMEQVTDVIPLVESLASNVEE